MLVPVKWLKEYVDLKDIGLRELSDQLTLTGSHVDSIIDLNRNTEDIIVGKIISLEKVKESDNLQTAKVDIGNKSHIQIVTGARNISEGDYIPVAIPGAVLPNGKKIEETEIIGIQSQGMMCSYDELGVDDKLVPKESRDGIVVFPEPEVLGKNIKDVLGFGGAVLDIEVTFNRPDCLSIIGIAREAAATFNKKLTLPKIIIENAVDDVSTYLKEVRIEAPHLCSRYYAKVIKDVKIGPSPLWLQRKIMDAGMRPINNIVDATNFVMIETGQPLHAFDLDKMQGRKIVVRSSEPDESIMTIDKETRTLDKDVCVIADEFSPQCIAGIMGGYDSEVTEKTQLIVMETANFNPKSIRLSSKRLGLRSEASSRNEKLLSPQNVVLANERVCQIIEAIGAGVVVNGCYDVGNNIFNKREVQLRPYKSDELLGIKIAPERMVEILNSLEITSIYEHGVIKSEVPHFRADIQKEVDLIEEVGRIHGFDKIQPKALKGDLLKGSRSNLKALEEEIKSYCSSVGLSEITTYSFISPKKYDMMNMKDANDNLDIRIMNPLGEDFSSMRTTMLPNMMEVVAKNIKYGNKDGKLFEIGNVFHYKGDPRDENTIETSMLSIGMYGEADFYKLKGLLENLFKLHQIQIDVVPESKNRSFHPGRAAILVDGSKIVGTFGEVHPDVSQKFDIKERVYLSEINLEIILTLKKTERKFKSIPKYPSITRDMAIIVKDSVLVGDIITNLEKEGYDYLESVEFFDIYTGEGIPEGHKSLAFSLIFREFSRTLQDNEVNAIFDQVISNMEKDFDAKLR